MRHLSAVISVVLVLACLAIQAADPAAWKAVQAAQAFRAQGQPVHASPDGSYLCEAEEFTVVTPGWRALPWGENDREATFATTFLSRKAFLGASPQCSSTATQQVAITEAGNYLVLVRYEAQRLFATDFRVKIAQAGQVVFDRLYAQPGSTRVTAFSNGKLWTGGRHGGMIWEGVDAHVALHPGLATISLIVEKQQDPAYNRVVDLILLTRDEMQVKMRVAQEQYLPLDGLLTQAGDVWLRVTNHGTAPVTVHSLDYPGGPMQQHSPYWVHMRTWQPVSISVEAGKTSAWTEVGSTMDALEDGQWGFRTANPCTLELGLREVDGRITVLRTFTDVTGALPLTALCNTRYTRRIVTPNELSAELLGYLQQLPLRGNAPSQTLIYAGGGWSKDQWALLNTLFGTNGRYCAQPKENVFWGNQSPAQLESNVNKLTEKGRNNIAVVSLGDEIGLPSPDAKAATDGFIAYLKAQGITADQLDPAAGGAWEKIAYNPDEKLKATQPGLYYWSRRFLYHYGIQAIKQQTDVLRRSLPNAGIGANFSPHFPDEHVYLGETYKWVTCFREDGMTMPWSEDYTWQMPVGTQRMSNLNLDLFRAGLRHHPERKIYFFVMPHMPGNTPASWRRMFFGAVGHGAKIFDLFEFDPVWLAYTENHVDRREMYAMVLKTLREYGLYEDIVQGGRRPDAQVGLWFSETGDIWGDVADSGNSAKRGLYIAILNQQVPLDMVVEQDALDGTLDRYRVLYLTDRHVSRAASRHIAAWVHNGGRLFATAGAGMFDEYNRPNTMMRELLGVELAAWDAPKSAEVYFMKDDLAFAPPVETVTIGQTKFSAFGAVSRIKPTQPVQVIGTFADGSPAAVTRAVGQGSSTYAAFLPSLSYFHPAMPKRPGDIVSRDDAMCHFIPTAFDPTAGALIAQPLAGIARPVTTSDPLVEASLIVAQFGTVVVLDNWRGKPIRGLTITLSLPTPVNATLAGGGQVRRIAKQKALTVSCDLDATGDVLILR